jgi:hypothetical protein
MQIFLEENNGFSRNSANTLCLMLLGSLFSLLEFTI